jgi:hypothetical protein
VALYAVAVASLVLWVLLHLELAQTAALAWAGAAGVVTAALAWRGVPAPQCTLTFDGQSWRAEVAQHAGVPAVELALARVDVMFDLSSVLLLKLQPAAGGSAPPPWVLARAAKLGADYQRLCVALYAQEPQQTATQAVRR